MAEQHLLHRARVLTPPHRVAPPQRGVCVCQIAEDALTETPQQPHEVVRRHALDRREEPPLVRIRLERRVDEQRVAIAPRISLERQGDRVAET